MSMRILLYRPTEKEGKKFPLTTVSIGEPPLSRVNINRQKKYNYYYCCDIYFCIGAPRRGRKKGMKKGKKKLPFGWPIS